MNARHFLILPVVVLALRAVLAAEPEATRALVSPLISSNGVVFSYYAPDAFSVSLTGEFNQWSINSHLMDRNTNGVWTITTQVKPGKYQYQFNVNGIYWKHDPNNTNKLVDSYGGIKSIVVVPETVPVATASTNAGPKEVRFTYFDPLAKVVAVGGFFNSWSRTANPMAKTTNATWVALITLKPGNHAYKFCVDGKWIPDPSNPIAVADGYGGSNSVMLVEP
jgi:1,4-alpha-glucan branching enzyme